MSISRILSILLIPKIKEIIYQKVVIVYEIDIHLMHIIYTKTRRGWVLWMTSVRTELPSLLCFLSVCVPVFHEALNLFSRLRESS